MSMSTNVRLVSRRVGNRFVAGCGFCHHFHIIDGPKERLQPIVEQGVVVCDQHPQALHVQDSPVGSGNSVMTRVPPVGTRSIWQRPPSSAARWRRELIPTPRRISGSTPTPSSVTSRRSMPFTDNLTVHTRAREWRATLVSASRAMR
jgi:hypothetical protein